MKRLIVNADDFGMTRGVNRAIIQSHQHGLVTSATMMATGSAFENAVTLARANPRLGIGCHVNLVQGRPLLPPERVRTLAPAGNRNGARLRDGFPAFAIAALRRRIDPAEIAAEAEAQMSKLRSAGIALSHFDTHKHVHLLPQALRPLLEAARVCGVRAVRNPFEPGQGVGAVDVLRRPRLWKRSPAVGVLRRFAAEFRRQVEREGMITTDGTIGITVTGCLDEAILERVLRRLPQGTWELVCHPAYMDDDLRSLSTLRSGERERAALTSARIRRCVEECGIELITYRDLVREVAGC